MPTLTEVLAEPQAQREEGELIVNYVPGVLRPCDLCNPSRKCFDGKEICLEEEGQIS